MGQVFHNILENALSFCRQPGVIEIRTCETQLDEKPAIRVAISDNGQGLNAEQRQHVFDPFFTTQAKGTGLGMAIAKRIVEAHGGQLSVGEAQQPGACFLVTLPRGSP
jgi:signal transduction histidine kinase